MNFLVIRSTSVHNIFPVNFPIIIIWGFSRRSRAANSAVHGRIWPNLEFVQDFMDVLVKKIQFKIKALECSQNYTKIFQMLMGS